MRDSGAHLVGAVFNGVDRRSSSGYYYYGSNYRYYAPDRGEPNENGNGSSGKRATKARAMIEAAARFSPKPGS